MLPIPIRTGYRVESWIKAKDIYQNFFEKIILTSIYKCRRHRMKRITKYFEKGFYVGSYLLTAPYYFFYRQRLIRDLQRSWELGDKGYVDFQKRHVNFITKAAFHTEHYRKLYEAGKLNLQSSLSDFPLISKEIIKKNPKVFVHENRFIAHSQQNTGGSTGEPFYFFTSLRNRHIELAHQRFFYERFGYSKGDIIWSLDGVRINSSKLNNNIFWKKRKINFPFGRLRLAATVLNKENAHHYLTKIIDGKPAFLRGYPSAISFLAESIVNQGLESKFSFLKAIMLTSETIDNNQIRISEKAFSCPILPQYGMTESCAFGFTEAGKLKYYCSPYYGVTEILDEKEEQVAKGEVGEIVLTSLGNNYQPFIRYKTGDLAQFGGVFNGFTILESLLGRTQDYIVDKNNNSVMVVGLIFGSHSSVFNKLNTWQIFQEVPGFIDVRLLPEKNWGVEDEKSLLNLLNYNNSFDINLIYTDEFILTKSGKRKFIIQTLRKN